VKKYKFSLERVLRVRKIQQALKLAEHKRAERALAAQQQKLAMFAGERDLQCESMEGAQSREYRAADRMTDWRYLQRIERIVTYQGTVVREYTQHESDAKKRFQLARQSCLSLEKLEDRQREVWVDELIKEEQKSADDRPRHSHRDKP
jgi:flagellar biosynthesis chaperone FliJ